MRVGVPKEIKVHEYRAGLTPTAVRELVSQGHEVVVEAEVGEGAGFPDEMYRLAGATLVIRTSEVFAADMIIKVKEPRAGEIAMLRPGQILFTYLHLAANKRQTIGLMRSGATCIAYETVTDGSGALPLLTPMSEVAGRMSLQVGAHYLERSGGGSGVLLSGVPGVTPGKVVILGGGVSGTSAARIGAGMGADVTVIDNSLPRLRGLDLELAGQVTPLYATLETIEREVTGADLVIGAVLVPGGAAPKLVSRSMLKTMRPGSVLVDISIDQGGCFETSRPTTHTDPTYVEEGIVHYCVTNMPSAVARTSTIALCNVTMPFVLSLAAKGLRVALADDPHLRRGLNVHNGKVTHKAVARDLELDYQDPDALVAA